MAREAAGLMALPKGVEPGARGGLAGDEGAFDDPARESWALETMERVGTESRSCGVGGAPALGEFAFGELAFGESAFGESALGELGSRRASSLGPGWVGGVVTRGS